jgi:hypothetical protein
VIESPKILVSKTMNQRSGTKGMFGKVSNALIRKEADIYLQQGLHVEALDLFKKFLDAYPKMSPNVRSAVEEKIRQIEAELEGNSAEVHPQLTQEHIAIIRQGWYENANADDIMVCAKTLHAMGFFGDALLEFKKLIGKGYSLHRIIAPVAECLAHLHEPDSLVAAVDGMGKDMFPDAKSAFSFKLSIAEHLVRGQFVAHAAALGRHFAGHGGVPATYRVRLDTLVKALKSAKASPRPSSTNDRASTGDSPPSSPVFRRIWNALRFFSRKRSTPGQ